MMHAYMHAPQKQKMNKDSDGWYSHHCSRGRIFMTRWSQGMDGKLCCRRDTKALAATIVLTRIDITCSTSPGFAIQLSLADRYKARYKEKRGRKRCGKRNKVIPTPAGGEEATTLHTTEIRCAGKTFPFTVYGRSKLEVGNQEAGWEIQPPRVLPDRVTLFGYVRSFNIQSIYCDF